MCMMPEHPVILVIHLMYGLHLRVTSFKKAEVRNNKINVYDGKTAREYELSLPKKRQDKSIAKKWLTKGKIMLHLHYSNSTVVQFCILPYDIFSNKYTFILFYNVVILYFTNII